MSIRRRSVLVAAALLLPVCLAVWDGWLYFTWDNFGVVEAGRIYRSGRLRLPQLAEAIQRYGLRAVVNLSHHADDRDDRAEEALVREMGLRYVKVRWAGNGVVPLDSLHWAADLLSDPANQPVLVHCVTGTNRTGAAVAAFRILKAGWSRPRVREEMERYGYDPGETGELDGRLDALAMSLQPGLDR